MKTNTVDLDMIEQSRDATQKVGVMFDSEGEPTAGFVIVGKDSPQYREVTERLRVAGVKRGANHKERIDTKTDEGALEFDRTVQRNEVEIAVAVTVGWFGFVSGGAEVPFSQTRLREVFAAKPTWRERVSIALENEAGFLPSSPATSESSPGTSSG